MGWQVVKDPWTLGILSLAQNDTHKEDSVSVGSVHLDNLCGGSRRTASTSVVRGKLPQLDQQLTTSANTLRCCSHLASPLSTASRHQPTQHAAI